VVSWGRSSNVFLENGARLYLDVGSHPEYATPECDSIEDVVAHDKAGERILEGLVTSAEQRLEEEGIRGEIYLFKNNTDSAGNSYGCHENYLVSRHKDFHRTVDVLIPFLVTRQIFLGAGKLPRPRAARLLSGPAGRAHLGGGVVGDHPIAADHQHPRRAPRRRRALPAPPRDRRRLQHERVRHLREGGNMVALLQMIERDVVFRDLTLENPIRAIREIVPRHHLPRKVRLANGRELSALDIQWEYLDRAMRFARSPGFPPQVQRPSTAGSTCSPTREGSDDPRPRGRLGDEVSSCSTVPDPASGSPCPIPAVDDRPLLPRRRPQPGSTT
jgi:proteasome accessory factor A